MNARRVFVSEGGTRHFKVHCSRCHRVECFPDWAFTGRGRLGVSWLLGETKNATHFCSWRCFQRDVKLVRDPLPIPTPVNGTYEFALGFWACMKGYGAMSKDGDYQRGYGEAMELRKRYYVKGEKC